MVRQRTLIVEGRITVQLVSCLTRLDLTKNENIWRLVCSETVVSILVKLYNIRSMSTSITLIQWYFPLLTNTKWRLPKWRIYRSSLTQNMPNVVYQNGCSRISLNVLFSEAFWYIKHKCHTQNYVGSMASRFNTQRSKIEVANVCFLLSPVWPEKIAKCLQKLP